MLEEGKYRRLSSDMVHGVLHRHHGAGATTKRDGTSSFFDVSGWFVLQSCFNILVLLII